MRGHSVAPPEADAQGGVFTAAQALSAGYTSYRVRNLLRQGRWIVVLGSVYAERTTYLTHASLARSAVLVAGAGAVASHITAARLWDLAVPEDPDVHATIEPSRRVIVAGLRVHRVRLRDDEMTMRGGVPVTRLDRTVVDCLLWLPEEAGRALVTSVMQRHVMTLAEVRHALVRCGQRHGSTRAWAVLHELGSEPHSVAEARTHRILRRAGILGWRANVPVHDAEGLVGIVDILFDDVPLVVEIDGRAHHSSDDAFQRDRSRQNRLVRAGFTVLRFTWDDLVSRPKHVVAEVRTVSLALRRTTA
jgi:very-short-patch-repair endonuclease